ncbi:hypothetical protein VM98_34005, partial [Streptomyces rubellomurinus subsp. indigoferus]
MGAAPDYAQSSLRAGAIVRAAAAGQVAGVPSAVSLAAAGAGVACPEQARGWGLTTSDVAGRVTTPQYGPRRRVTAVWASYRPTTALPGKRFT